ncbi:M23 family metallopeptidase [Streptomyces sp. Tu102]|uniref:M23 family metallopeptidase n=1 Tax=Streptomyces sp. Tu102 TaxID=2838019 RepID=UPI001BDD6CB0|nr:M23 family metallopeptidase [Streptomyces sp. Tu102]MBT1092262.1 M23 family metallopeptidase [Streptomyces sp. Tu102]
MSPRFSFRSPRTSALRTRAAVLAAGLGASVVLGAGGAVAAEMTSAPAAPAAVQAQTVAVKKAAVKKAAAKKAPAKKAVSWVKPVKKYTKSASFAQAGGMWQSTHSGQDFAVPTGTQVVAAHGGTVVKAGGNGAGDGPAYGNAIVIKHGNGTFSQYAHLSRIDVKIGQVVKTGQKIAKSGNTGNSSGPHLHFEIRKTANYGSAVDPVAFLRANGLSI